MALLAQRIRAWIGALRRTAEDRAVLVGMSNRDLKDIGLERGFVESVADGAWTRDFPR
jgi:uncharacterized protein YjiS (DUF1127 family)